SDGENMFEILMPAHRITNADLLGQKQVRPITLYVNSEVGDDSWTGMHPGRPKKTIQSAVDALPAIITFPVRIQVAPGMYPEQVLIKNRHVNAPTANIHIISEKNESAIHPRAIVTGKDNETSPPVRNNGFLLDNVSDIILEGFGVESTTCEGIFINKGQIEINDFRVTESLTNAGIKCVEFSNLVLRNTSITKSVSGVSAVTQSTVKAYDCIIEDMSPYHGFSGTGGSTLALYNCSISNCHGSGAIAFYMATISLFDCNISNCGKGNYFWGFECWDNSFGKLYATKISNCVTGGVKASRSGYIQFRPHPDTSKKCEVINNPVGLRAEMLSAIENFEGISLILNNTINISSNQNGYFYYIP
ncbi:MAG TPA: right-handed parallel beta-helix repeat-containing protein, partial [Candidatus Sumerlaeota bacterium]|nr:right-handed parallel beta-helix repeat-containing protein [Candidatus Sumerlaeota bacterium]